MIKDKIENHQKFKKLTYRLNMTTIMGMVLYYYFTSPRFGI